MYEFQPPLEIADFSGGKTDNYIDAPNNQAQEMDNFFLEKNKKLLSRGGTIIHNATAYQIPAGNQRIGALIKHPQNELYVQSARNLYYISGTYQTLVGPVTSNPAFSTGTTSNYISWSDFQNQTYFSNDAFCDVIKVYKNSSAVWKVNTAGLPGIELEGAIDLANDLKAKYNAHAADAAQHTVAPDLTNIVTAANAFDEATLFTLVAELVTDYSAHDADAALASGRAFHATQESPARSLATTVAPKTLPDLLDALDDIKSKYNAHDAGNPPHPVTSSHQSAVMRTPQVSGGAGTDVYLYKLFYQVIYTVDDVTFEVQGPTFDMELDSTAGTFSLSQIPAISNGTTRCLDTANITVEIYRTIKNGQTYYRTGAVANGTTTFSDTTTDDDLQLNDVIYTDGGELDNEAPPRAKYTHIVNGKAYYANIKRGNVNYASTFCQGKPDNPDAAPSSFDESVEAEITGFNSIDQYPILFCRARAYRIEGAFDGTGQGNVTKIEFSKTKGTISNLSVVRIPSGLVFAAEDGFYFTDGYNVQLLSKHLIATYKDIIATTAQEKRIYGEYDYINNRVHWGLQNNSSSADNDKMFILDLNYPMGPESVFTTITPTVDGFSPTAMKLYNGTFVIGDRRGYLFDFDDNTRTDLKINTATNPSTWTTQTVIWDYTGFATTFGSTTLFKFVPSVTIQCKNQTNVSLQIKSNNDDSGFFKMLKEIRNRDQITWGDPNVLWNSPPPDYAWNVAKILKSLRLFPSGLRCVYKQIQITNAYTYIYNSDTFGTGTTDAGLNTLTLDNISNTLPTDIVDYFVSFEDDNYTNDFLITTRNSATVLTFSDPSNLSPTGSLKWIIKGYPKGEILNLLSYALAWAPVQQHQDVYRTKDGANA